MALTPLKQRTLLNVRRRPPLVSRGGSHQLQLGAWAEDLEHLWWSGGYAYPSQKHPLGSVLDNWAPEVGALAMGTSPAGTGFVVGDQALSPESSESRSMQASFGASMIPQPWTIVVVVGASPRNPETVQRNIVTCNNIVIAHDRPVAGANRFYFYVASNPAYVEPTFGRPHWFICRRKAGESMIMTDEGEVATGSGQQRNITGDFRLGLTASNSAYVGAIRAVGILDLDVFDKWKHWSSMVSWLNGQLGVLDGIENLWVPEILDPRFNVDLGEGTALLNGTLEANHKIMTYEGPPSLAGRRVQFRVRSDDVTGAWRISSSPATGEIPLVSNRAVSPGSWSRVEFDVPEDDTGFVWRCGDAGSTLSPGLFDLGIIYDDGNAR